MGSLFKTKEERHECGRYLSLVLRELAPSLGVDVDYFGYVPLDQVVDIMCKFRAFVNRGHIAEIVEKDAQHRFEVKGDKIRTKAGHRYSVRIPSPPIVPPELLYHGTCREAVPEIVKKGILRMSKAYVHLSTTVARAIRVGLRKSKDPHLLLIRALQAHEAGVRFWRSGQVSADGEIILSDDIPPQFIEELPVSKNP